MLQIEQPIYYHREYKNDLKRNEAQDSWGEQSKRIALVALPFISLYKPLSKPLSIATGGFRSLASATGLIIAIYEGNTKLMVSQSIQVVIATSSLAGSAFAHPLGMLITTGHDLLSESQDLLQHLLAGNYEQAFISCATIANNGIYLGLYFQGGLELSIVSIAMQVMMGVYHSHAELKKGNRLEAAGHLVMAMIRGNQLVKQGKMLQLKYQIEKLALEMERDIYPPCLGIDETGDELKSAASVSEKISTSKNSLSSNKNHSIKTGLSSPSPNEPAFVSLHPEKVEENAVDAIKINYLTDPELFDVLQKYSNHPQGWSALNNALENNDFQAALLLIDYTVNINKIDGGQNALDRAFAVAGKPRGDTWDPKLSEIEAQVVYKLIEKGVDTRGDTGRNTSPLSWACRFNDRRLVQTLLERGSDINELIGAPLKNALEYGRVNIVEFLLSQGVDLAIGEPVFSAVHYLKYKYSDTGIRQLDLLIESGANINRGNILQFAMSYGGKAAKSTFLHMNLLVQVLLERGANPNAEIHKPNRFGYYSVLEIALGFSEKNQEEKRFKHKLVEMLISYGAKL